MSPVPPRHSNEKGEVAYQWRFIPEDTDVQIFDHGPPEPVGLQNVEIDSTGTNTWSGPVAASGKISVMAQDSTQFAHVHVTFSVTERSGWTVATLGFSADWGTFSGRRLIPGGLLGFNGNSAESPYYDDVLEGVALVYEVLSGPNRGYGYVNSESYFVKRKGMLNWRITQSGPADVPYVKSNGDTIFFTHWTYLDSIYGHDPKKLRDGVRGHESFGLGGGTGHQPQLMKAFTTSTCKNAAGIVERIVGNTWSAAQKLVDKVKGAATKAFQMSADHHRVHGNYFQAPVVTYDGVNSPYLSLVSDAAEPAPQLSEAGCNWIGVF